MKGLREHAISKKTSGTANAPLTLEISRLRDAKVFFGLELTRAENLLHVACPQPTAELGFIPDHLIHRQQGLFSSCDSVIRYDACGVQVSGAKVGKSAAHR